MIIESCPLAVPQYLAETFYENSTATKATILSATASLVMTTANEDCNNLGGRWAGSIKNPDAGILVYYPVTGDTKIKVVVEVGFPNHIG